MLAQGVPTRGTVAEDAYRYYAEVCPIYKHELQQYNIK